MAGYWLNKKLPVETRLKMSLAHKGKPTPWSKGNGGACKGRKATPSQAKGLQIGWALRGDKKGSWKGGATEKNWGLRRTHKYRKFRNNIVRKIKQCVHCGTDKLLQIDHIKPVSLHPDLLFDESNIRVLCQPCHIKTNTFGGRTIKWQSA